MPMRIPDTFTRSAAVGLAATVLDLLILWVLVDGLGMTAAAANVPALLVGVAAQFAGNKWLAFRDRSPRIVQQGVQFALVEAGALLLNAVGFHLLVTATAMPYLVARMLVSSLVYAGWSYGLWARIFRGGTAAPARPAPAATPPPAGR